MAHHGIAYLVDAPAVSAMKAKDGADGKPGWSCYGGTGLRSEISIIASWTPGTLGIRFPAGTGFLIEPNQAVVLQLHYNLWTTNAPDRSRVAFELESGDADLTQLYTLPLTAPVEIPCPAGVAGPQCERENAIKRLAEVYGAGSARFADRQLRICRQTLADYAGNTGAEARGVCDTTWRYSDGLTVYGALAHMHELGVSFRMTLNPESEAPVVLLDIPRWDFYWQEHYTFAEPLVVERGDVVRIECVLGQSVVERAAVCGLGRRHERRDVLRDPAWGLGVGVNPRTG